MLTASQRIERALDQLKKSEQLIPYNDSENNTLGYVYQAKGLLHHALAELKPKLL